MVQTLFNSTNHFVKMQKPFFFSSQEQHSIFTAHKKYRTTTLFLINFQMTFQSHRKYNFHPLPRQLLSATKGKMVNTLSESTIHNVFIHKETVNNRAYLVFFFFFVIFQKIG